MNLKFITGNKNKFKEVQEVLTPIVLEQYNLNLEEIQDLDPKKVIEHKLNQALKQLRGPFIIEDTSFSFEFFDYKLPGPFIKFFNETLSNARIYEMARKIGKFGAMGITIIGYVDSSNNIFYFEGKHEGLIVEPKGDRDFGYGPLFKPNGHDKTFGEMDRDEKYKVSARAVATIKLKEHLLSNGNLN
jgi:inosine triphosphate pyrophosphatase